MSETNLHKRIQELESENRLLRSENERLRKSLGLPFEETPKTQNTPAMAWAVKWLLAFELVLTGDLSQAKFNEHGGI